jgi:hypothetical protein
LAGVQAPPVVHGTHAPALQTMSAPQDVPSGTFPDSAQTADPVEQEIDPTLHAEDGVQAAPDGHATQLPLPSQTLLPPPQACPAGALPVSVQVVPPEAPHASVPVLQPLGPRHADPSPAHVTPQLTPSHVADPPAGAGHGVQDEPQVAGDVLLTHTPLHSWVPIGQPHVPAVQVFPLAPPQGVPSATLVC